MCAKFTIFYPVGNPLSNPSNDVGQDKSEEIQYDFLINKINEIEQEDDKMKEQVKAQSHPGIQEVEPTPVQPQDSITGQQLMVLKICPI